MAVVTPGGRPGSRWIRLGVASASAVAVAATIFLINGALARTTGDGLFPSIAVLALIGTTAIAVRREVTSVGPVRSAATGALVGVIGVVVGAVVVVLLFVAACSSGGCFE